MTAYAQSLIGGYRGSRMAKARYMYEKTVLANFIELRADERLEPEDFRVLLEKVQGVKAVTLHDKSKEEQGNPGAQDPKNRTPRLGHYQAHNFMVFSTLWRHGASCVQRFQARSSIATLSANLRKNSRHS